MLNPDRDSSRRTLLTVPEVAAALGCGRTLVYDLIGARQLPVVKIGRLTRIPIAAVDDFVNRHVTERGSPPIATPGRQPGTRSISVPTVGAVGVTQGLFAGGAGRGSAAAGRRRG